jgi:uncharacterized secreted protein with C-terminal beta-propeller domain
MRGLDRRGYRRGRQHDQRDQPGRSGQSGAIRRAQATRVLNQFSMDEYDGYLRIATSNGRVPEPDVESALSVLKLQVGDLGIVGHPQRAFRWRARLPGHVREDGPLVRADLSDPEAPAVVGELIIPGFSTYMRPRELGGGRERHRLGRVG